MCSILAFPLELLDKSEHEPQRCYVTYGEEITEPKIPVWAKCLLQDDSYAICRVLARAGTETCCFMDDFVTSTPHFNVNNKRLTKIVPLTTVNRVEKVACVLTITAELLQRSQISVEDLRDDVHSFLRYLMLTKGCVVQHKRLKQLGIASVEIFEVPDLEENECFELKRDTNLLIVDVRLELSQALPTTFTFYPHGFECALQALEDLLSTSRSDQGKELPLNALIVGAVGIGKSTLLAEFMRRHRCNCFYVTASQVLRAYPGETEEELRKTFEAAHTYCEVFQPLLPVVILLEDLEMFCPATTSDAKNSSNALRISAQLYKLVDELPRRSNRILCLATSSAPHSLHEYTRRAGRFANEIVIDMPTELQRQHLFACYFTAQYPHDLSPALMEHVGQHTQGYVVADLALLMRQLQNKLLLQSTEVVQIEEVIKQTLLQCQPSASRSNDVRVMRMTEGFEIIGGMATLKRTLQVSILAGLKQSAAFARFGLSLPKGVLLYGPPGCAKTTIAKCLAKEAHMTFISTSAAEVYSPYVGCAERFVTRIFDTARKNAPCLIFLDEIDALVGRRTISSGGSGSGDVQMRILSTLLTEMDGIVGGDSQHHILVVAATNRPDMIDDALIRPGRFDKLIHVPAPDSDSRLALLQLHAKRMPFDSSVDIKEIAERTERYSGADLCNLCNEAAMRALQRDFDAISIQMQDFEEVLGRVKSSLTQSQIDGYYKFAYRFL
ncbi:spermatogenesis-associated protein 5-like protein 1 [Scaptodrosophila lebanonensis]|uniref:Spermatogenesis-associated protein 5-like protein 1 n=1 Tax=Drosophila lebanonensis TaxID=7225 RepID=A0A6J2UG32_DROLE|nr:spermatogenesis-associated protein 5-like protein 1 [Scaptodrosophila lebanonensis]